MNWENILNQIVEMAVSYGPKLLLAVLTLTIGWMVINVISKGLRKMLRNQKFDQSLITFLYTLVAGLLKVLLILSVLGMVGVEVTSFIAFLGAAGLAIGLALQGSLQNFAGGVMILIFKPYKVGDLISAQGYTGTVSEIQIFQTILKTVENNTIVIPNSPLSTGSLTNYSTEPNRRVDVLVPIGNGSDIDNIKKILYEAMKGESKILTTPAPYIVIVEYGVGTVKLAITGWCQPDDYWTVFFYMNEMVKREFDKHSIAFPTPAQFIHMVK
ncbi:MAG TPA: mechanosensitive ion channel protein MscS [Bacteroidales bacterium]|nr:mechanosensitive ion channel protein MscS [Bacteroidales bacterium]